MASPLSRLLAEPAQFPWFAQRRWTPWLVVGLVSLGAFIGQLDATIVQLALPTLGRSFGASLQAVSWVALAYLLAFAAFLPVFGRLCEMLGRKSLYLAGFGLFSVATVLCGMADSLPGLIGYRVLQGIGGALLGANSIAVLVATVPAASRGRAMGYFAGAQAVGMSAGPALGGVILDSFGWRWIFWVTVPFGLVAMLVGLAALPPSTRPTGRTGFDWLGATLIGPALILVVLSLNHAVSWGVTSPLTLGCVAGAGLLLWMLWHREGRTGSPLIDPRLYRSPGFRSGAVAVAFAYALLYGIFFLMSFAQEHGYGESPAQAGLRLAIIPVALGLTAPFSHDIAARIGTRRIGMVAMVLCLVCIALLGIAAGQPADHRIIDPIAYALAGVGLGLFIAPNNTTTIGAAPAELSGSAGAQLNLMRVLGTSLGVAAGATMLSWRLDAETGAGADWMTTHGGSLLAAFQGSLPVLAVLALGAAIAARLAATSAPPALEDGR